MFARILNGAVEAYPVSPQQENPNTSFPFNWLGGVINGREYVYVIPTDVPQLPYTQNHVEGTPSQSGSDWYQVWEAVDATPEQIQERTSEKESEVRADRNARLAACDWTQLPDAPVDSTSWATYRQALRDVTSQVGFPWNVVWPEPPA